MKQRVALWKAAIERRADSHDERKQQCLPRQFPIAFIELSTKNTLFLLQSAIRLRKARAIHLQFGTLRFQGRQHFLKPDSQTISSETAVQHDCTSENRLLTAACCELRSLYCGLSVLPTSQSDPRPRPRPLCAYPCS